MEANRKSTRRTIWALGAALTLLAALLYIYQPPLLRGVNLRVLDALQRASGPSTKKPVTVVVDIDETSLREFGQWPWPRYRIAALLSELQRLGAQAVGIDIVFPEPDRLSPIRYLENLEKDRGLVLPPRLAADLEDNDRVLADVLSRGRFILGYKFLFGGRKVASPDCVLHPVNPVIVRGGAAESESPFLVASGVVCNIAVLAEAASASGFLDALPDEDGILRRIPLIIESQGLLYPSLALATVLRSTGVRRTTVRISRFGVESLELDGLTIPVDGRGSMLLNFSADRNSAPRLSAAQVMRGEVAAEMVKDRLVLLGASAVGLEDTVATPISPALAGVDIHATVVDNLLQKDFLQRPPFAAGIELLLVLLIGVGATFLIASSGAAVTSAVSLLAALGLWLGSIWLLQSRGIVLSPLYPLNVLAANFLILTVVKFWQGESEVRRKSQELIQAQKVTIRSLASLSETRDPQAQRHILRTQYYVEALARKLSRHPRFKRFLETQSIEQLAELAALHDIGKVGVPDSILLKPGRLTEEEFEEMKRHTIYGEEALSFPEDEPGWHSFLEPARKLILSHHERWDGSGYPRGLKADQIPVEGRLMAVADVYDALVSRRVYKPAFAHEQAVEMMREGRGSQFDPDVLDAFLELQNDFKAIAERFPDPDE